MKSYEQPCAGECGDLIDTRTAGTNLASRTTKGVVCATCIIERQSLEALLSFIAQRRFFIGYQYP